MKCVFLCVVCFGVALTTGSLQAARSAGAVRQTQSSNLALLAPSQYRAVLDKYCVTCHNEKLRTAGLALDKMDLSDVGHVAEVWEKVARKLRSGEMPPAGLPRPDQPSYDGFAGWLEGSLDAAALASPNPGRPVLHRLNRPEYANAIRDLLSIEVDVSTLLPPDDSTYGFDNISDVLGISPLLLESYVTAGRKISRVAIGDPAILPVSQSFRLSRDLTQNYHLDGMPLGTRGGVLVRHEFPLDGEYEFRVFLLRTGSEDQIRGLDEPHVIELAIDGSRAQLFKVDGGRHMYEKSSYADLSPAHTADAGLRIRVPVKAGPHAITVAFPIKTSALSEDATKPSVRTYRGEDLRGLPHVARLDIAGPYMSTGAGDTPSRRRIFTCRPSGTADELACAKQIISTLARRAYRRSVTAADVEGLLEFYEAGRQAGGFEAGIESALWRILASPQFVFRFERDPANIAAGAAYRVTDVELASRLSFFLWSSPPDDTLLDVAIGGRLKDPAVFDREARRMVADPRSQALVSNFAGQWLHLRNLESSFPNPEIFPDFDDNLRQALRRETELFFDSIMREDRSVLDLLNADYTFVNERLAKHYGIPNIRGDHFRRVAITDARRRGLLGQGSILTATSYATRTSPVLRGKWVLENILGAPPPPPPPNVPELNDGDGGGKVLSMRDRMAAHRANAVCASCHARMDPIGFALENFDAVGNWRAADRDGMPIDASGALPDGTAFDGPEGLRTVLMRHPEAFVHTFTEKLLTYALGRGLTHSDAPVIRAITREAGRAGYSFSSLLLGVIKSLPFQMRRAEITPDAVKRAASR